MCQQWFTVVGLILDVIGFLTIAYEWHHMYGRDREKRRRELDAAYERNSAALLGTKYEDPDEDASMWREFQKLFLQEWSWRARVFGTGVALVIFGFLAQLLGSLPYGMPFLNIVSCPTS